MASIKEISGSFRVLVRRKGHPQYCRTFPTYKDADRWGKEVEAEIDAGRNPALKVMARGELLIRDAILKYRRLRASTRPIRDDTNEHYMLKALDRLLGDRDAMTLVPDDLVGFCLVRKDEGAGPYTCNMDIGKLGTVLRMVGSANNLVVPDVIGQARPLLSHMGLIGGGGMRDRRPTDDEFVRIEEYLRKNHGAVYADFILFAKDVAMRRSEITSLRWADVDEAKKLVLIRNRKHPRKKIGNDQWIPLLGDSWGIVQRQPKEGERIFPVHPSTISKYFKGACDALSIVDLRLHDLRHEGISGLFELGYDIPRVAMVSGHKDWRHLKRYTNLKPEHLHDGP